MTAAPTPALTFDRVSHRYSTDTTVLSNVSMQINSTDFIMVTGPSGSGKSTFLQLGALLEQPSEGEVYFQQKAVSSLDDKTLSQLRASRVGIIFQAYHLLPRYSVFENVLFGFRYSKTPMDEARQLSQEAMQLATIDHLQNKSAGLLSGGEMQRVAIARAIASRPDVLFADEPTGNLDRRTTDMIMATLATLHAAGLTIVMATHDDSLVPFANRHYQLTGHSLHRSDRACHGV